MFHMLGLLDGFKIALNKFYLKLMICGQLYGEPGEGTVILLVLLFTSDCLCRVFCLNASLRMLLQLLKSSIR